MPYETQTKPVEDSIAKVDNEIAVGADLDFQAKWWRFEVGVWIFFTLLIVLDFFGFFGRGPFAKTESASPDKSLIVNYERVERYGTPSILTLHFGPLAQNEDKLRLWVSENLTKDLGAQRVVPQPEKSELGEGGILYTFSAIAVPADIEFALQPAHPGLHHLQMRVPGHEPLEISVVVMP